MAVILPITYLDNNTFSPLKGPFKDGEVYLDCRDIPFSKLPSMAENLAKENADTIYLCLQKVQLSAPNSKTKKRPMAHYSFLPKNGVAFSMINASSAPSLEKDKAAFLPKEDLRSVLYEILDAHHIDDVTCYYRSNLDRKLFAKIRHPGYNPKKSTLFAIIIGCHFSLGEASRLLEQAGYAFSPSIELDAYLKERVILQDYSSIHEI
nr:hypothetical protein [Bacilli bacterium]